VNFGGHRPHSHCTFGREGAWPPSRLFYSTY
jgi:hypothetical protein